MTTNPYDQGCRYLARLDPVGMLAFLLSLARDGFAFVEWLDTRGVSFPGEPERTCDTVAFVRDLDAGGVPWAVILEFQAAPDGLMFGRLLVYRGMLWGGVKASPQRGDRFAVGALVVNLTGTSDRDYAWEAADQRIVTGKTDRNLCEHRAAEVLGGIKAGKIGRVVLPWIVLMHGGGDDGIIQDWKALAEAEPDAGKRADYGGLALVFAELTDHAGKWKEALKGWSMIQSKQVQEWQAQARDEGRSEGRLQERRDALLEVLEARCGVLPNEVTSTIHAQGDPATLKRWLTLAARAASLEQFKVDAGFHHTNGGA